jgi:hypothetical protein
MIEWQLDRHGDLLPQRGNSRDPVVVAAVSRISQTGVPDCARLYTNFSTANLMAIAITVTAAQSIANNSP